MDTAVGGHCDWQVVHPRMLARMRRVALSKFRDMLLGLLDKLISDLEHASTLIDGLSVQAEMTRVLRVEVADADIEHLDTLSVINKIQQTMNEIASGLEASNPE